MKNNKKIGIIGGVGPQSTNFIYKKIVDLSQKKYRAKNNNDYPELIIHSIPIPDFISNISNLNEAKQMLIDSVQMLEKSGATKIAIASNTVHILLEELKRYTKIEFLPVYESVVKKIKAKQYKKVGLLGTPVLLKSKLYENELSKNGIQIVYPNEKEMIISDQIIRQVIAGKNNGTVKRKYIDLLHSLFERGAEIIILGCTELPQAINYEALGNKTINSDEVLAEAIVDYYYQ